MMDRMEDWKIEQEEEEEKVEYYRRSKPYEAGRGCETRPLGTVFYLLACS